MSKYKKQRQAPMTEILRDELKVAYKNYFLHDIAKKTNINRTTLSQFLNHKQDINYEFGCRLEEFLRSTNKNSLYQKEIERLRATIKAIECECDCMDPCPCVVKNQKLKNDCA